MRHQGSYDWAFADYMEATLVAAGGVPLYWKTMVAGADAAIHAAGGPAHMLRDDPPRFGRVMHLAKIVALQNGHPNPMPVIRERGWWVAYDDDGLVSADAAALCGKYCRSRFGLIKEQIDAEVRRTLAPESIRVASDLAAALRMLEVVTSDIEGCVERIVDARNP